ncbi:hypothetical protein RJG79_07765 [Mycoplasmatota bacterium WC44]
MRDFKKRIWIIIILYFIVDIYTITQTTFDFSSVIRIILATLLFYYVYNVKNWARVLHLVLLWIAIVFGVIGILFSFLVGFEGMLVLLLQLVVNIYSVYILSSRKIKIVFKESKL